MLVRTVAIVGAVVLTLALAGAVTLADAGDDVELDAAKQKHIWDLEHVVFQLEHHVGKPFVAAWTARDAERLRGYFHGDFAGRSLEADGVTRRLGALSETNRVTADATDLTGDATALVVRLITALEPFREFTGARLRVLRIDQLATNSAVYRTRVLLEARGRARDGGPVEYVAEQEVDFRVSAGTEVRQTPIIAAWRAGHETLRVSRVPLMEEVTDEVGLADLGLADNWELESDQARNHRLQIAVEDFDRDGYPDIAVATVEGRPLLLHSRAGRLFVDVTREMGINPAPSDKPLVRNAMASWIDINDDGYPDLILGERVHRNIDGRRFVDITSHARVAIDRVPMGAVVADFDVDGDLDLYVVYQKTFDSSVPARRPWVGDTLSGGENHLWVNDGAGRFTNVTERAQAGGGRRQTFAASAFYFDDDHLPDLYLANDLGVNVLLRNRGDGTFEDVTDATASGDFATSMGVSTGDLDNDGRPEIYVANMFSKMGRRIIGQVGAGDYPPGVFHQIEGSCAGNRLYTRQGDGLRFVETSEQAGVNGVGWAYAPTMVDLDGNGLLDLYATTGFMSFDREKPDG